MVPYLMRHNIRHREFRYFGSIFTLKFIKETHIHIYSLISWTIKRPHRSLCCPTSRLGNLFKHHHFWFSVLQTMFLKNLCPSFLRFGSYHSHKFIGFKLFFSQFSLLCLSLTLHNSAVIQHRRRVAS